MIGICQYGFGVKWCNGFSRFTIGIILNQFFCTYREMVKSLYGVKVIWLNGSMVNPFLGHISIDGEILKWENA